MKVLTYTLYKEHYDLYTKILGSIAVNSCQIRLAEKDTILLSKPPIIIYEAGTTTSVENRNSIHSSVPAGTYSIDNFNTKIKEFVLQQMQDWEPPQIKDLKQVIPKDYTFLSDNTIFIVLAWHTRQISWKDYANQVKLYPLAHTKHPLIFFQDHCQCTVNKLRKLKTS